jgi:hypothetical protein
VPQHDVRSFRRIGNRHPPNQFHIPEPENRSLLSDISKLGGSVHRLPVPQMVMPDYKVAFGGHIFRQFLIPVYIFQHPMHHLEDAPDLQLRIIPAITMYHMNFIRRVYIKFFPYNHPSHLRFPCDLMRFAAPVRCPCPVLRLRSRFVICWQYITVFPQTVQIHKFLRILYKRH